MEVLEAVEIEGVELDGVAPEQQMISLAECQEMGRNVMVASLTIGVVVGGVLGAAAGSMFGVWLARRAAKDGER